MALDRSNHHPDADKKAEADDLIALMTPILKGYFTDMGSVVTNLAVQIHGGHGYIQEYGVEQYVRDARIAEIYEGTNGIQALDLVGRKMAQGYGRLLRRFFHPVQDFIEQNGENPDMMEKVAMEKMESGDGEQPKEFYESKLHTARFFFTKMLPEADWKFKSIMAGAEPLMAMKAEGF